MSGSGSGSSSSNFRPAYSGRAKCDIDEETLLSSPDPDIVNNLNPGDKLEIEVESITGGIIAKYDGDTAGTITSARAKDLKDCLDEGNAYEAEVIGKDGGAIRIRIYRV